MRLNYLLIATLFTSFLAFSKPVSDKETKHHSTVVIQHQHGRGDVHIDRKSFCADSKEQAYKLCQEWAGEQKKTLGDKLLTNSCAQAYFLYGKEEDNCMGYLSRGEIKFYLK